MTSDTHWLLLSCRSVLVDLPVAVILKYKTNTQRRSNLKGKGLSSRPSPLCWGRRQELQGVGHLTPTIRKQSGRGPWCCSTLSPFPQPSVHGKHRANPRGQVFPPQIQSGSCLMAWCAQGPIFQGSLHLIKLTIDTSHHRYSAGLLYVHKWVWHFYVIQKTI